MITLLLSFFVLYFTVDHKKERAMEMQSSLVIRLEEAGVNANKVPGVRANLNIGPDLGEHVDRKILAKVGAQIHDIGDQLIIEFADVSFYNLGVVDVNRSGTEVLNAFANTYVPFAGRYELAIRAFTDTRPVKSKTGRFKDNLELSALRSVSAMRVLQAAGIPLKDMRIAGLGEMVLPGQTEKDEERAPAAASDNLKFARKVILVIEPKRATGS
jgi:flagellar motor protein MotB